MVLYLKKKKKANVAVSLLCCTKSFLETECEKEKYLAILRHLGYNYKKIKPTLVLFARREILILAMLTFSISQACLKWFINQTDFNDIMILKDYSLWYSEGSLPTTVGIISIPFLWKLVATLF